MSADRESVNARVARGRGEEIARLNKRVAELERQLAEAREARNRAVASAGAWARAFRRAADEIAEARAALEFYAREWRREQESGEPYEPTDALWADRGERARSALNPAPADGESAPCPAPEGAR